MNIVFGTRPDPPSFKFWAKMLPFYTSSPELRRWEYCIVMDTIGLDPNLKYLSVGGWYCVLTYILSHIADILSIDKNGSIVDWVKDFGVSWGNRISFIPSKSVADVDLPYETFDRVFAVSAIEHSDEDEDIRSIMKMSQALKVGGIMSLTIEWGEEFIDYDPVVGGRIYDTDAVWERLIKPTRLKPLGEIAYEAPDWRQIKAIDPRFVPPHATIPFAPASLNLIKE